LLPQFDCFIMEIISAQTTCLWWQFSCDNGKCIDLRRKCNGYDECGDRSDERGCGGIVSLVIGYSISVKYSGYQQQFSHQSV